MLRLLVASVNSAGISGKSNILILNHLILIKIMKYKCKKCGYSFNPYSFGETKCPKCGCPIDEETANKVNHYNIRVRDPMFWVKVAVAIIVALSVLGGIYTLFYNLLH